MMLRTLWISSFEDCYCINCGNSIGSFHYSELNCRASKILENDTKSSQFSEKETGKSFPRKSTFRVVQTQAILLLKSMSKRVGFDIKRL